MEAPGLPLEFGLRTPKLMGMTQKFVGHLGTPHGHPSNTLVDNRNISGSTLSSNAFFELPNRYGLHIRK